MHQVNRKATLLTASTDQTATATSILRELAATKHCEPRCAKQHHTFRWMRHHGLRRLYTEHMVQAYWCAHIIIHQQHALLLTTHAVLPCTFRCNIGLHCGELNVNSPATKTAVPTQKLLPRGGAGGKYGRLRVKANMVAGTMLDMTSVCTTLPAHTVQVSGHNNALCKD